MKPLHVAAAVLVVGTVLLGAGVAPSLGCEQTYALQSTPAPDGDAAVVNASALPDDVRADVAAAVEGDERVPIGEVAYKVHLEDRRVRYAGTTYATSIALVESCGGTLEAAFLVAGTTLATLGAVAFALLVLYRDDLGPSLSALHAAAAITLVLGATLFAGGVVAPAGCTDNYALETTEIPGGANATNETVVDASAIPLDLANATKKSVETNRTAFVDRGAYREHLENRSVRYAGSIYDPDLVLVQDCGGGIDDALLVAGLVFATLGAVALALLVTFDHGEKVL